MKNMKNQILSLEKRIETIKRKLARLGDMRPGSLSKQYNVCGNPTCRCKRPENPVKHGTYYQISYTYKGRSKTEFVTKELLSETRKALKNYQTFKKLTKDWGDLSLELAKLRRIGAKSKQ